MAGAIVRLRSASAAVGGIRQLASSAVGLMLAPDKVYWLGEKKVVSMNRNIESERVVGSSHGWVGLMKLEEDRVRCGSNSGVSLWNPMSGSRMELPPIHTITSITSAYPCCRKLMVDDSECSRAIIVGGSWWLGACWGGRCSEWTEFGVGEHIEDAVVACSGSRVFTVGYYRLGYNTELVRWNVSDPRRPRREWRKDVMKKRGRPRLGDKTYFHVVYAEQSGQLFLLTRYVVFMNDDFAECGLSLTWDAGVNPEKTVAFDVRLVLENDNEIGDHDMDRSLDGLVMFVGINNSFAVAAADFPHLKPDSIYFTDHPCHIPYHLNECYCHDVGIYDYKNRTISSPYHPAHLQGVKMKKIDPHPHPFWLTGS